MRIGPFAVDGSTTFPFWVMTTSPRSTSLLAADRAGSMSSCHCSPPTRRAASLGQIVEVAARFASKAIIAVSRGASSGAWRCLRHLSEQNFTSAQFFAHAFRQRIVRPHTTQTLASITSKEPACLTTAKLLRTANVHVPNVWAGVALLIATTLC
jgi:hypothetical protein